VTVEKGAEPLLSLERIREPGAETLVPGHGPVCTPAILDDLAAYFRFVQETARAGKTAGSRRWSWRARPTWGRSPR